METENDTTVEESEEETPEEDLTAETDWEAEAKKARGIAQRLRTKLTKATEKKKEVEKPVEPDKKTQTTEGLDETALDYLDLKGYSEDEDINIIESIVKKTGQTVRQVLKDEYVQSKLAANKEAREARAATPSSSKRGGGNGGDTLERALAKYEQSGMTDLPDDFDLRTKVIDAFLDKKATNRPTFRRT